MSRQNKSHLSAQVPKELKRELEEIAKDERRSVSAQLEIFLSEGVKHRRKRQLAAAA